jgi:hypothetical protein
MKEAFAVTGFVSDADAKRLSAGSKGLIRVSPERGVTAVLMEVDSADVTEVRVGSSKAGQALVQLILRDRAVVRTVIENRVGGKGVDVFADPAISRLTAAATAKQIVS